MEVRINQSWKDVLNDEFEKEYFVRLVDFIRTEYKTHKTYPPGKLIFNAFEYCSFDDLKVVILGQDPYHGPDQANGLCFSVNDGIPKPPSLVNIFKEIKDDLGIPISESGNLERWARQGILLLNATLTVRANQAGSHQNKGWEIFTDAVIKQISEKKEGIVFLLWGLYAQRKGAVIDQNRHCILKSAHPSPLSAYQGFLGNKHFSQTNSWLIKKGVSPIIW
jgi:uracil-DNA glycosylase